MSENGLSEPFVYKTIFLPRQARDKHRESTSITRPFFLRSDRFLEDWVMDSSQNPIVFAESSPPCSFPGRVWRGACRNVFCAPFKMTHTLTTENLPRQARDKTSEMLKDMSLQGVMAALSTWSAASTHSRTTGGATPQRTRSCTGRGPLLTLHLQLWTMRRRGQVVAMTLMVVCFYTKFLRPFTAI